MTVSLVNAGTWLLLWPIWIHAPKMYMPLNPNHSMPWTENKPPNVVPTLSSAMYAVNCEPAMRGHDRSIAIANSDTLPIDKQPST